MIGPGGMTFRMKERFRLNTLQKFFTEGVVRHWHRLFRELHAPSLDVFKARLDQAWSSLEEGSLFHCGSLGLQGHALLYSGVLGKLC